MESTEAGRLVRQAADGDARAWRALVEGFSGLVWSITRAYRLSSADAADVFQTVWLRLAEHLGRVEKPEHVGGWLATTARRESLRLAHASTRFVPTPDETLSAVWPADEDTPEQAFLEAEQAALDVERAKKVWRAFGELPSRCQQLLRLLTATPSPSYAEVAAALDMRVGSIGPTRARCLQQLRLLLGGEVSGSV